LAAAVASRCGMSHLGICKLPDCRCVFIDASAGRASLCCAKHCGSKANVTALPSHRRTANGFSAAAMADSRRTQQTAKGGVRAMSGPRAGCVSVRDGLQPFRFAQWMPPTGQQQSFAKVGFRVRCR